MSTEQEAGSGPANRPRDDTSRRTFTEAKPGYKTSEFLVTVAAAVAMVIATYADEDVTRNEGWRNAALVAIAYIVSRGLAKLGTREPSTEER